MSSWKPAETRIVKMDGRHKYIRWLLEKWDKQPGRPLPDFSGDAPASMLVLTAMREDNDQALEQYKRLGYAYVEAEVGEHDDDEPYLELDEGDVEYHKARLLKDDRNKMDLHIQSLLQKKALKISQEAAAASDRGR